MIHLGSITNIHGGQIPAVDVITGGSPCQDLSVAGKRAGLDGERSRLFMEQIRVIKEMRCRDKADGRSDEFIRPRYMVWENVPGALSSNKGKDFQTVLTETIRIAEPQAPDVPMPEKKWPNAGCLYDGLGKWSIAWRIHDAQYWGVPQRRRRICLLADFNGKTAGNILFGDELLREAGQGDSDKTVRCAGIQSRSKIQSICESLSGDIEPCKTQGEETAGEIGASTYPTIARALTARADSSPCVDRGQNFVLQCAGFSYGQSQDAYSIGYQDEISPTLRGGEGGNQKPCVIMPIHDKATRCNGGGRTREDDGAGNGLCIGKNGSPSYTLTGADRHMVFDARGNGDGNICCTITGDHKNRVTDYTALCVGNGMVNQTISDKCNTLDASHQQQNVIQNVKLNDIVRRLTPLECERLQGYPDGWTDIDQYIDTKGRKHKTSDSARYKALGDSIALPFWRWLAGRICAQYDRQITIGSLFDGIGGFPLVFEQCGAKAVWASEIEEFCIAVTKRHFPDMK